MRVLYTQQQFPVLQNRVYETAQDAIDCPRGDIEIVEDRKTGLIYNAAFNPDLMVYDEYYNNEQGHSQSFRHHLGRVAELIGKTIGKKSLVEVGCGKGFFLEMLLEGGFDVRGFDPTYDGKNPRIIKEHFKPNIIASPTRGLILRHVLEHVLNPYDFLRQLRDANGGSGIIYIEVPCFDWIIRKRVWCDIFYEHVNYFRLSDFDRLFGRVLQSGRLFGDQYLYVIAELATLQMPIFDQFNPVNFPSDFLHKLSSDEQNRAVRNKKPVCVWGGASKGVIFTLLRKRASLPVDYVIDINPAKQGKFLPVSGVRVLSPDKALAELPRDTFIYVMNSNYLEEVKEMSQSRFDYVGIDQ